MLYVRTFISWLGVFNCPVFYLNLIRAIGITRVLRDIDS